MLKLFLAANVLSAAMAWGTTIGMLNGFAAGIMAGLLIAEWIERRPSKKGAV